MEQTGPHDLRDAVTHLQVVDKADIPRMAKLNVIAVTDPHWFFKGPGYFDMTVAVLGRERAENQLLIEAATLNEAYQMRCDDRLGSITVGKEADLAVLDTDITKCDPEHIRDAVVLGTMVGGKWVYTENKKY